MSTVPDVSYWQGVIPLNTARQWYAAGIREAVVKIGGGDSGVYHDSRHDGTVTNLRAAGIVTHRYYFNGGNPATAARQVAAWLNGAGSVALAKGECLFWDVEAPAWSDGQVAEAIKTLEGNGYPRSIQGFYSSSSQLRNYAQAHALLPGGLWVAQYGTNTGKPQGTPYTGPWAGYRLWQFTSNGRLPGYSGRLDLSSEAGTGTQAAGGAEGNITTRATADVQKALTAKGFSCGASGADGIYGPDTTAAVKAFQKSCGIVEDGVYGPVTDSHLFGTPTAGAATMSAPAYPLPAGSYFGPRSGGAQSISGYFSHRTDLRRWQQRMRDRGWVLGVDGLYGPETAGVTKAFQAEKHLTVDSLIGPQTWAAAWTTPIT